MNVTVTRRGEKAGKDAIAARYTISFDRLPGQPFGPYNFIETCRDLTVSALLPMVEARALVLDAWTSGSASRAAGGGQ